MKFRIRIILAMFTIALGAIFVGIIQIREISQTADTANHIAQVNLVGSTSVVKMMSSIKSLQSNFYKFQTAINDPVVMGEMWLYFTESADDFEKFSDLYLSGTLTETEVGIMKKIKDEYLLSMPIIKEIIDLSKNYKSKSVKQYLDKIDLKKLELNLDGIVEQVALLSQIQNDEGYAWSNRATETSVRAKKISYISISTLFLAAILFSIFISHRLSFKLKIAADNSEQAIKQFKEFSKELLESSSKLCDDVAVQAAMVQRSGNAVVKINSTISKVTDGMKISAEDSTENESMAQAGKLTISELIDAFGSIDKVISDFAQQLDATSEMFRDVSNLVKNIEDKTKVIDEIVFQTRLLSFNASVEAARAGEYGKGFAVVAEEVGNLAKMSGQASVDINTTLSESFQKFEELQAHMSERVAGLGEQAKLQLDDVTRKSNTTRDSLESIAQRVSHVHQQIDGIRTAMMEQVKGTHDIREALDRLENLTQNSHTAAIRNTEIAQCIDDESNRAIQTISQLKTIISGTQAV